MAVVAANKALRHDGVPGFSVSPAAVAGELFRWPAQAVPRRAMGTQALFGLSVLMSFVAFGLVTKLYIWPRLRMLGRDEALV